MLKKLNYKIKKNAIDVDNKKTSHINTKVSNQFFSNTKKVYDSDWQVCELVKYKEATTTTEGLLLPEKASYDFEFELDIPEAYLPCIRYNVIAKTVPEQVIKGVGEFIFTSLIEILLDVWQWKGVTQLSAPASDVGGFTNIPISEPQSALPSPSLSKPLPISAYSQTVFYESVEFPAIGTGLGPYDCNASGTIIYNTPLGVEESTTDVTQWIIDTYTVTNTSIVWHTTETVDFIADTWLYPPANDDTISWEFPNGTTDDVDRDSTPTYPNQYWEKVQPLKTFSWFLTTDGADWGYSGVGTPEDKYDYVYAIFKDLYPGVTSIISEYGSSTYHAYRPVENNVIKSANQQVIINCNDIVSKNKFAYNIKGYFLLLSEANTETSWSDGDNPTYEPNGEDMQAKVLVYYDTKLNTQTIDKYETN